MITDDLILSHLLFNEEFGRKTIPFLKDEYFKQQPYKIAFKLINEFVSKYNEFPTKEALQVELNKIETINEVNYKATQELIGSLSQSDEKLNWLIDVTEKWCQERALESALIKAIKIQEDKNGAKGNIPKILQDALGVSFDTNVGHDFIDDFENRYEYYTTTVSRIPFDISLLNVITNGGLPNKTFSVILAPPHAGKSQLLCYCAGANLRDGYNVLYISLEMSQEEIAKRIDANLLDISMDDFATLDKEVYERKITKFKTTAKGKLVIKEYPTSQAHAGHFRHLLNELALKKNFKPDIIYIDYINICASARIKRGQAGSYDYIKAITEELRGLAVEFELPIVSATQVNRSGANSSDLEMTDIAESFGISHTADLILALIVTEQLEEMNQAMIKQIKNRLGNKQTNKRFIIGMDRMKMRFFDVDPAEQEDILDGPTTFDNTKFGTEERMREKFSGFR